MALSDTLHARRHWLFDMDGTLTIAAHDFDAIRDTLALPAGVPILEALAAMSPADAASKRAELDALELDMAAHSRAQPGAVALLESLATRGCRFGIVTRNGRRIADATLQAAGLFEWFDADSIVSRDCALPKPDPAGVHLLLQRWQASADDAVMVGDFRFDLEAGHRAGCATVHLNVNDGEVWPSFTDLVIDSLERLNDAFE